MERKEEPSTTLRIEANLVGEAGDNALHYIYFEIIGDPCILIGYHWFDLFANGTTFALIRIFSQPMKGTTTDFLLKETKKNCRKMKINF